MKPVMKPRRPVVPPAELAAEDEDAFVDLCAAIIDALQIPEVAAAVADAIGPYLPATPVLPAPPAGPVASVKPPGRHSSPARGQQARRGR